MKNRVAGIVRGGIGRGGRLGRGRYEPAIGDEAFKGEGVLFGHDLEKEAGEIDGAGKGEGNLALGLEAVLDGEDHAAIFIEEGGGVFIGVTVDFVADADEAREGVDGVGEATEEGGELEKRGDATGRGEDAAEEDAHEGDLGVDGIGREGGEIGGVAGGELLGVEAMFEVVVVAGLASLVARGRGRGGAGQGGSFEE